jgi:hypothetical protein
MLQTFVRVQTQQASTVPGSETEFRTSSANRQSREAEHQRNPLRYFSAALIGCVCARRMVMPVLLVPALFIGGTAVVVGGGYFLLHGLHVIAW